MFSPSPGSSRARLRKGDLLRVLATFVLACLCLTSVVAAQCEPDSCPSGVNCEFDGITNVALGQAQLSLNGSCNLVVSNIGSSGQDGVSQDPLPPDSELMITGIACPNFLNSVAGSEMQVDMEADGSLFSTMTATNTDGNTVEISADFSPAGATLYAVTLFDDAGKTVGFWTNLPSGITQFPKNDIIEACCDIWGNITYELTTSGPITVVGGQTRVAKRVKYSALDAIHPAAQTKIDNFFADTGPIEMTFQFAGPQPQVVPTLSQWALFILFVLMLASGTLFVLRRKLA